MAVTGSGPQFGQIPRRRCGKANSAGLEIPYGKRQIVPSQPTVLEYVVTYIRHLNVDLRVEEGMFLWLNFRQHTGTA